jgi:predicted phosphodiesterase
MRIAAISDVHGNIAALEAVLHDIEGRSVDMVVNLGDIFAGTLRPRETADLLIPLGFPTIRGNHERQMLAPAGSGMNSGDRYAVLSLRRDQMAWVASLPESLILMGDVLLVHGTPTSDTDNLLETIDGSAMRAATGDEVEERIANVTATMVLCGHTHVPRIVRTRAGQWIVNPGSVDLPTRDRHSFLPRGLMAGPPKARYAVIEKTDRGWSAELAVVDY